MKQIRSAALEYKKQQKAKANATINGEAKEQRITTKHKKNEPKKVTMTIQGPEIINPATPAVPRYSTYKKSVWSQFT